MEIYRKNPSYRLYYLLLFILLVLIFLAELMFGSVSIPPGRLFDALLHPKGADFATTILWSLRLPRACTAILAGSALSVCGLQMQTLFRNPLADPYILGISSGAGLGVAFFVMGCSAGMAGTGSAWFINTGIASAAWAGALAVSFMVMFAAKRLNNNMSLLIFGIMIGSAGSAIISLFQYFSSASELKTFVLWTMGSFSNVVGIPLGIMTILVGFGLALAVYNIKILNVLLMGETYAKSLGLHMNAVRNRIFISTALLAGSVTAFCGPIGFIGIAVPHLGRMLFKNANHKRLIPATALLGACVTLFADFIAQLPGSGQVLPINTVAALIGIPVILMIILQHRPHE
ncbi:MAG: iron ABC transporter permease [Bacteroidetes bacterium]|nr:iron ABC transporter permease [Bacteroidota bacterium]